MNIAILAVGLVLVFEGLAYALAPSYVERVLEMLRQVPIEQRRIGGLVALALGVALVWMSIGQVAG